MGTYSPSILNNQPNLYYQYSIIYVPEIFKKINSVFNLGVHRVRYYYKNSYKWFHISLSTKYLIFKGTFNSNFIYLFNKWNRKFFEINYSQNIKNSFFTIYGFKIWKDNSKFFLQPNI